jgi:hypothetical protein
MLDPLDELRRGTERVAPRPEFEREVLARVRDDLHRSNVVVRSVPDDRVADASVNAYDVIDEALEMLRGTGPEFDPFGMGFCLSNHAPMAVEAMCAMGRPDAVIPWVERYRVRLPDAPKPREPIPGSAWREALGNLGRAPDWVQFFTTELAEASWTDVLNRWVPRLAPAAFGGGTHGVLRTAHAARSLGHAETPQRHHELAEALGYWAACYETLPEAPGNAAHLFPAEALSRVEQLDLRDRANWVLFVQPIAKLSSLPSFGGVADLVDVESDPSAFLSELSESIAALLVSNVERVMPRALVHALTAGAATRLMLPYLSPEATATSLRYGWQVAAAFYAALVLEPAADDSPGPDENIEDLVDEAIACPDEHGIKVTEACLREYALNPKPVYLRAARDTTRRLVITGVPLT